MTTDERLLNTPEVAARLRVKPCTLAEWRRKGIGPKTQPVGSRIFYRETDVTAWLDAEQERAS